MMMKEALAKNARGALRLLPQSALVKTGDVDHADWNYRPVLGAISRLRFRLVAALLDTEPRAGRLLEIGYGSGVLMPELARRCEELYGVDVHGETRAVADALAATGVEARLFSSSVAATPFADNFFDAAVAVSAFEFVEDLPEACAEITRVLKPGGVLVVVTPGYSPLADFGLRVLTGKRARADFEDRRRSVIPTFARRFRVEQQLTAPALGGAFFRLYTALKLRATG